tara:strand:- start:1456 stop:2232 length:777 start_codon:yes stop_codon:yes gene_type:complete
MTDSYINNEIYTNPQVYNDIMWWKKDDIKFWTNLIHTTKSKKILELCCGTGRIGLPLIELGLNYYGIDSSDSFINFFKKKTDKIQYDSSKIISDDIRNFNIDESFDLIFIGFNSLAHLLKNQDLLDTLKAIKSHMHSNTIFAIDVFVPDSSFLYRVHKDKVDIMDFIDSSNNQKLTIFESTDYNSLTEINRINWDFIGKDNVFQFNYAFDMRMWFPDTLNRILTDCNYHIQKFYGDYDCNPFNEKSEKQIYLCKKYIL